MTKYKRKGLNFCLVWVSEFLSQQVTNWEYFYSIFLPFPIRSCVCSLNRYLRVWMWDSRKRRGCSPPASTLLVENKKHFETEVRVYLTHPSTDEPQAGESLLVIWKWFAAKRNQHHLQNLGMLHCSIHTPHSHLIKSTAIHKTFVLLAIVTRLPKV